MAQGRIVVLRAVGAGEDEIWLRARPPGLARWPTGRVLPGGGPASGTYAAVASGLLAAATDDLQLAYCTNGPSAVFAKLKMPRAFDQ